MLSYDSKVSLTLYENYGHIVILDKFKDIIPVINSFNINSILCFSVDDDDNYIPLQYNICPFKKDFNIGDTVCIVTSKHDSTGIKGIVNNITDKYIDIVNANNNICRILNAKIICWNKCGINKSSYIKIYVPSCEIQSHKVNNLFSYIFSNIGWSTQYNIIINEYNDISLYVKAIIFNNTDTNIRIDNLILMSGKPNKTSSPRSNYYSSKALASSFAPSNDDYSNDNTEYYPYNIDINILNYNVIGKNLHINLFDIINVPSEKYFRHNISTQSETSFGYLFETSQNLPAGNSYIYSKQNNIIGQYIGSSRILDHRANDLIDINVGNTTLVKFDTVLDSKYESDHNENNINDINTILRKITTNFTTKIVNSSLYTELAVLRFTIGNNNIISVSVNPSVDYIRKDDYIEWSFDVSTNKIDNPYIFTGTIIYNSA